MTVADRRGMYAEQPYQGGDPARLVERYGDLVKRIAHHLLGRLPASVQLDDLVQSGLIGLLEAARSYDAGKGASFETYAGIRIRGAMIDEMRQGDWAPRSVHRNARRIQGAMLALVRRLGREPTDAELAVEIDVPLDEYHAMSRDAVGSRLFSLDELTGGEDRPELPLAADTPGPSEDVQRSLLREHLARAIAGLPERERLVLSLYYGDELNLKEIGLVLGVSESRVSQIHSQAALRLRARMAAWQEAE